MRLRVSSQTYRSRRSPGAGRRGRWRCSPGRATGCSRRPRWSLPRPGAPAALRRPAEHRGELAEGRAQEGLLPAGEGNRGSPGATTGAARAPEEEGPGAAGGGVRGGCFFCFRFSVFFREFFFFFGGEGGHEKAFSLAFSSPTLLFLFRFSRRANTRCLTSCREEGSGGGNRSGRGKGQEEVSSKSEEISIARFVALAALFPLYFCCFLFFALPLPLPLPLPLIHQTHPAGCASTRGAPTAPGRPGLWRGGSWR